MAEDCCSSNGDIMILACSGASNVGQLSNRAAIELTQEGFGKMFCLAGIGGHLSGFIQSAKDVENLFVDVIFVVKLMIMELELIMQKKLSGLNNIQ